MRSSQKRLFVYVIIGVIGVAVGLATGSWVTKLRYERLLEISLRKTAAVNVAHGDPIEILDIPSYVFKRPYRIEQITTNERQEALFVKDGVLRKITYQGNIIKDLEFSPIVADKAGFFYYPHDNAVTDVALAIMNIPERTIKEVYRKSVRTSGWEWDGTKRVIVYYNGGTGVLYAYKIDVETGETVDEYFEYETSPIAPPRTERH